MTFRSTAAATPKIWQSIVTSSSRKRLWWDVIARTTTAVAKNTISINGAHASNSPRIQEIPTTANWFLRGKPHTDRNASCNKSFSKKPTGFVNYDIIAMPTEFAISMHKTITCKLGFASLQDFSDSSLHSLEPTRELALSISSLPKIRGRGRSRSERA